jgi:hypothetical protein
VDGVATVTHSLGWCVISLEKGANLQQVSDAIKTDQTFAELLNTFKRKFRIDEYQEAEAAAF